MTDEIIKSHRCDKFKEQKDAIDHCGEWMPPISMNSKTSYFHGLTQCSNCFWSVRNTRIKNDENDR